MCLTILPDAQYFNFELAPLWQQAAYVQCECVCGPMRTPLRATSEGFINRTQAHLFTHHAHHHLPLTICTPQPPKCKSQAALASKGL